MGRARRRRRGRSASPAVGYAILGLGKKLPLKPMLITGASILLLLSVAFVGNAVRSLQEADLLAVNPIHGGWARLPVFVAELTGIHPTVAGHRRAADAARDLRDRRRLGLRHRAAARRRRAVAEASPRERARRERLRVGVDVGGTFTKAVAVSTQPLALRAHAVVPTSTTRPTASSRASPRRCGGCSTSSATTARRSTSSPTRRRRR